VIAAYLPEQLSGEKLEAEIRAIIMAPLAPEILEKSWAQPPRA
jgi:hypothetical protein